MCIEQEESKECWKTDVKRSKGKNYICSVSARLMSSLFSVFVLCCISGKGQDLIIRIYGDTIYAKIDQEDERFIYYRTKDTNRSESEIIARKEVREIIYGAVGYDGKKIAAKKLGKDYETLQLSVRAGYSFILKTDDLYGDDFETVYDEMRGGVFLDARVNYFINRDIGLGVLYSSSRYQTNSSVPIIVSLPSGTDLTGELLHNRHLHYYAFNVAFRIQQSSTMNFQIEVGLGLLTFEDQAKFIGDYKLTSSSVGGHLSASLHLELGEGFYLPAVISLKGFSLSTFDLEASANMNPELVLGLESLYNNLEGGITTNRVQLGLGLGFAF